MGKKIKMRPSEVREVQFKFGTETVPMLSVYNSLIMGSVICVRSHNIFKIENRRHT